MLTDSVFAYGAHDFITRHLPNAKDDSIFQYVYAHQGKELVALFKKYGMQLDFVKELLSLEINCYSF